MVRESDQKRCNALPSVCLPSVRTASAHAGAWGEKERFVTIRKNPISVIGQVAHGS